MAIKGAMGQFPCRGRTRCAAKIALRIIGGKPRPVLCCCRYGRRPAQGIVLSLVTSHEFRISSPGATHPGLADQRCAACRRDRGSAPIRDLRRCSISSSSRKRLRQYADLPEPIPDAETREAFQYGSASRPAVRRRRPSLCYVIALHLCGINVLLGNVLSVTLRAWSAPVTGRPAGFSRPICTRTEA